jgi:hypothetical protein
MVKAIEVRPAPAGKNAYRLSIFGWVSGVLSGLLKIANEG